MSGNYDFNSAYRCSRCGGWFIRGITNCDVAHWPFSCCHHGETPCDPPVRRLFRIDDSRIVDLGAYPKW